MTRPLRGDGPRDPGQGRGPDEGSLENRLSLVQQMLDRAAAELNLVMNQLKDESPRGGAR